MGAEPLQLTNSSTSGSANTGASPAETIFDEMCSEQWTLEEDSEVGASAMTVLSVSQPPPSLSQPQEQPPPRQQPTPSGGTQAKKKKKPYDREIERLDAILSHVPDGAEHFGHLIADHVRKCPQHLVGEMQLEVLKAAISYSSQKDGTVSQQQ